jgi:uncharacterized protein (TIGR03083 family)
MLNVESLQAARPAVQIPYVTADEAHQLLAVAFGRFMALAESLNDNDWDRPTACTAWSVRDILAHQAGGYATGAGYTEMFRQLMNKPAPGQLPEDAMNARQLAKRAGRTPAELLAELRRVGPSGIQKWSYQFRFAKLWGIPHGVAGWLTIRHLMWVIHSRDTWMHRLDICRATGRPFEQTADHDGRIVALVMRDVGKALAPRLDGKALLFHLTGTSGGDWQVGSGAPAAAVQMDALDFNIFASGRFTREEALERAVISGERDFAEQALKNLLILY